MCPAERLLRSPDVSNETTGKVGEHGAFVVILELLEVEFCVVGEGGVGGDEGFLAAFSRVAGAVVGCFKSILAHASITEPPSHALASEDIEDCDNRTDVAVDVEGDAGEAVSKSYSRLRLKPDVGSAMESPRPAMKRCTLCTLSRSPAVPITLVWRAVDATVFDRACLDNDAALDTDGGTSDAAEELGMTNPRLTILSHLRFNSSSSVSCVASWARSSRHLDSF